MQEGCPAQLPRPNTALCQPSDLLRGITGSGFFLSWIAKITRVAHLTYLIKVQAQVWQLTNTNTKFSVVSFTFSQRSCLKGTSKSVFLTMSHYKYVLFGGYS